jgi:4-hydroxy-3-methylbut-2-en-1-yl diphosphate reductase
MRVVLAQPRGFCAGVVRAIDIVERALQKFGEPVFVRHEIVHNQHVVQSLKQKGARFVEGLDEIPDGAVTVFSAHGVAESVVRDAEARSLPVIDATCPLVSKVHSQAKHYVAQGRTLILIGHKGHPEVDGTMGQVPAPVYLVSSREQVEQLEIPNDTPVAYVTQTTLSIDDTRNIIGALLARFTNVQGPHTSDICYATQNRQSAVRELCRVADIVLVVGSKNSSNSNRLREIGEEEGIPTYLIADATALDRSWFEGKEVVGVTAGASAPEELVLDVIGALRNIHGELQVSQMEGLEEHVEFRLPPELRT